MLSDYLVDRIDASGDCWLWTGPKHPGGYGQGMGGGHRNRLAHRAVYGSLVGAIPDALEMDHLCMVKLCVNPDHLQPVDHATNMARAMTGAHVQQDQCSAGHRDWYVSPQGKRYCRHCDTERRKAAD